MKIKQKLMILMSITALFLSACDNSSLTSKTSQEEQADDVVSTQVSVQQEVSDLSQLTNDSFDEYDLYNDWSKANSNEVTMSNGQVTAESTEGLEIDGTVVTIKKGGVYAFTGNCEDGAIIVDSEDEEQVRIVLNDLTLTNTKGSAIYIKKAAKMIITSYLQTTNTLSDGESYADETVNAAIYTEGDLTINGEGLTNIFGNYQNAISVAGDLKITSGTLNIQSKDDGVVAGKGISIKNGSYNIQANASAFKTTSVADAEGFVGIESGNFTLTTGSDAVSTTGSIYMLNGSLNAITAGGSNISSENAKGLKAGGNVEVYGGLLIFDTADDSVYAQGNVHVNTGCFNISSGDDGIVAGEELSMNGGSITVTKAYEGIEANALQFNSGFVDITASNDGINIAGGEDSSASEERTGKNGITRSGSGEVQITETCINVKAEEDGIDVAGNISSQSGSVHVRGGQNSASGSIVCSGNYTVHGGIVFAAGNESELSVPAESSEQNIVCLEYAEQQTADKAVVVKDSKGNTVVCFAPAAPFQKVLLSQSTFEKNKEYILYDASVNGDAVTFSEVSEDNLTLGEKIAEFKVSEGITKVN